MDISFSLSSAGPYSRITVSVSGEPAGCELSAIMTSPSGREEIFLPSPDRLASGVTYPHSGGRFVTAVGKGKYQIIFQPMEKGKHILKILGRASESKSEGDKNRLPAEWKRFEKDFQMTF